ncbi:S-layer homology domain-containing protein [Paenibacillus athensensis]|uniref:SLH domain-containing protein n=1 Tax=Paenibacillus athensensis TaxID=1967502 RepID=A0A4Y8Q4I5_9BACL|nr:S-layer homology domain-containing protein [Paenibacillus athensensis]MCD1260861.1 S-layer homology domain-containing protein [Paenibacillus athensensis]
MSNSSSNMFTTNSNKTKDIRGGEKKVMKKSLKVIATAAMAFSMFSSVALADEAATTTSTSATTAAAAKTSADFKDLAGIDAALKAKIDALLSKGVFEGVSDDSFGIDENMTRAQFAKVLTLIYGVKVDDSVTASSFADVKADDAANGWAIKFIEAAKKAGLIDGKSDTSFDPGANVTLGEFATALVKGLGVKPDMSGTPWYADAVKQAVNKKVLPEGTDGSKLATRADLVVGAYGGQQAYSEINAPEKVSVAEAKATGVYQVTVTLDKAVDTAKAKLALTKGSLAVGSTTKWSDDKKSATLSLDTRLGAGDYTVTLSGLDAAAVDKTTATFTAQDEQVSKIDFVSANDTLPYSNSVSLEVKAANQYGEAVSLGASNFTALVSGTNVAMKKNDAGNFVINADVKGTPGVTQGNGIIPVTVYYNNSAVTASKNFKVGTVPLLTKIEAGKVTYSNGGTKLSAADETADIPLTMYDQYGNKLVKAQFTGGTPEIQASNINPVITPYEANLTVVKAGASLAVGDLFDDSDNARIQVKLAAKVDKNNDYTVNIFGGASSASATVSVGASNLATKVEFDVSGITLSADDSSVLVPVTAYDANGNKLSAQDVADNAAANRFNFTASNAATTGIVATGVDKGKLKITFNAPVAPSTVYNSVNSKVYISGQINQSQTNSFVQASIPVTDVRVPERIAVATENAPKAILGAGDDLVFQLKDQYGSDRGNVAASIVSANGQSSNYQVVVDVTTSGTGVNAALKTATVISSTTSGSTKTYTFTAAQLDDFNKGFTLTSTGAEGKVTVKATIQKQTNGGGWSDYSSAVSRTFESIKSDTALTYSLDTVGTLFAAQDQISTALIAGENVAAGDSQFDKTLTVIAKDSAGNKVKLPYNYVRGISSSNPNVLAVANPTPDRDGFVLGNKAGTATVTAIVYKNNGETVSLSQDITVKADSITVDKLTAGKTDNNFSANGFAYDFFTDGDNKLKVTDQYGIEYTNADIAKYDAVLGLRYTVKVVTGSGMVTINSVTGEITNVPSSVKEFTVTAIAPNGKSVSILLVNTQP